MRSLNWCSLVFLLTGCSSSVEGTGEIAQEPNPSRDSSAETISPGDTTPNKKSPAVTQPGDVEDAGTDSSSNPPDPSCTSFVYSSFGECALNGKQSRTVLESLPKGCSGGSPVVEEPCACTSLKVFEGSMVKIPNVDLKPAPAGSSCIETWTTMGPTNQWPAIVLSMGENVPGQDSWVIDCSFTGTFGFRYYRAAGGSPAVEKPNSACNDGSFHHVAMCFDDTEGELFMDGVSVGKPKLLFYNLTAGVLNVGGWPSYPTNASILIDELRVSTYRRYTGNFSPEKHPQTDANTKLMFHLDEGAGSSIKDTSGFSLNIPLSATWSNNLCP